MSEILKFTVDKKYDGIKAGRYLRTFCKLSSRTLVLLKRTDGGLRVNGNLLRTVDTLRFGDAVEIALPSEKSNIIPIEGELNILYEDNFLLAVSKPADMPVHPVKTHRLDTLANIVAYRYKDSKADFVFRAVNRLDRDTSGIVLIAKDRHTASILQAAQINKHYIAVCHGKIAEKGTVSLPISISPDSIIIRQVSENGKEAVTHYTPLTIYGDRTVLDITLETGRTHQIRCHMSHIGHPLLGDDLYGGSKDNISRQALHCFSVSFLHPYSDVRIELKAPIPEDINRIM